MINLYESELNSQPYNIHAYICVIDMFVHTARHSSLHLLGPFSRPFIVSKTIRNRHQIGNPM